jgi:HEAT repeat protein
MRRVLWIAVVLMTLVFGSAWGQQTDDLLNAFQRNFVISSLDVKIQILQDAADKGAVGMGPLYLQAIDYVLSNASLIPKDSRFGQLSEIALEQIGALKFSKASRSVWQLFEADTGTGVRVRALTTLGTIAAEDEDTIQKMVIWLDRQNIVRETGKAPDVQVVAAAVTALGRLGAESAFQVLFTAMYLGYSDLVTSLCREALLTIRGEQKQHLLGVLKDRPIPEKRLALVMALESERLKESEKAEVAAFALDIALHTGPKEADLKKISREIRKTAVLALGERQWSAATPLLIENFDATLQETDRGLADKSLLLEAIAGLGNMQSSEAAVRLTQYLVLLNSYAEKGQGYDEQIVMAVVTNLGKLGDKTAFDDLMYVQYLNYSGNIRNAARTALEKIKW